MENDCTSPTTAVAPLVATGRPAVRSQALFSPPAKLVLARSLTSRRRPSLSLGPSCHMLAHRPRTPPAVLSSATGPKTAVPEWHCRELLAEKRKKSGC